MPIGQCFVGEGGGFGFARVHAERRAIDNEVYGREVSGKEFGIFDNGNGNTPYVHCFGMTCACDEGGRNAQTMKAIDHGTRCASRAENKGTAVVWTEQGAEAVGEADEVGIETVKQDFSIGLSLDAHHIDSSDGLSFGRKCVEVGYHGLFVGNGHVEADEVGMIFDKGAKIIDGGKIEVVVAGGDALSFELFGKEICRKTMPEGMADESVLKHGEWCGEKEEKPLRA